MTVRDMEHVLVIPTTSRRRDFYCTVVGLKVGERPPLRIPVVHDFIEDPNGVRVEINVRHTGGSDA